MNNVYNEVIKKPSIGWSCLSKPFYSTGFIILVFLLFGAVLLQPVFADQKELEDQAQSNTQVIDKFVSQEPEKSSIVTIEEKEKHAIMFYMGVPLLLLLIITGVLGVAMGVYGKQVFVAHMVCAGLSVTLAVAHAVVGVVWFYPF